MPAITTILLALWTTKFPGRLCFCVLLEGLTGCRVDRVFVNRGKSKGRRHRVSINDTWLHSAAILHTHCWPMLLDAVYIPLRSDSNSRSDALNKLPAHQRAADIPPWCFSDLGWRYQPCRIHQRIDLSWKWLCIVFTLTERSIQGPPPPPQYLWPPHRYAKGGIQNICKGHHTYP